MSASLFCEPMPFTLPVTLQALGGIRETELSVTLDDEDWRDIWRHAKSISVSTSTEAIQFKMTYRKRISPNHHFKPALSPVCLKCEIEIDILTYYLWSRRELQ